MSDRTKKGHKEDPGGFQVVLVNGEQRTNKCQLLEQQDKESGITKLAKLHKLHEAASFQGLIAASSSTACCTSVYQLYYANM